MGHVFTRRMTLESPVRSPDGAGGFTRSWVERGALWAEVRMRSGALRHSAFGRTPRLQVRIRTHALPEGHAMRPVPGDHLRDGGQVYENAAVHADTRHVLTILGSVVSGEGGGQ